jgi:hypothetical protein
MSHQKEMSIPSIKAQTRLDFGVVLRIFPSLATPVHIRSPDFNRTAQEKLTLWTISPPVIRL